MLEQRPAALPPGVLMPDGHPVTLQRETNGGPGPWAHGECLTRIGLPWITDHLGKFLHGPGGTWGRTLQEKECQHPQ